MKADTLSLLKEEINKTMESVHDLAKWKLGVTAALGAAAFGLAGRDPNYWLLLFVPFVCAYVDLYTYQYEFRILVIAQFLREHPGDDTLLQRYEEKCELLRKENVFSLGRAAGIGSSFGASVLGPIFYLLRIQQPHQTAAESLLLPRGVAGMIWMLGVLLIVFLWRYFQDHARRFSEISENDRKAGVA